MTSNRDNVTLEPAAQTLVNASSTPPFLYQLPPAEGRAAVDQAQAGPVWKPDITEEWVEVGDGATAVRVRVVRPVGAAKPLPVVLYIHGAGWVFGDAHTHDRLVRDLCVGANAAVVFPEYDHAPEARYPHAIEQSYRAAQWASTHGVEHGLDATRVAIAGDSVGGNMAIAVSLLAAQRADVSFVHQVLFYPVTDASFDTASYHHFAEGYYLNRDGMMWFWDQYTTDPAQRAEATASPLRADLDQLALLPPTLLITAEADVLRDEGEAFAARLRAAGVRCANARFGGTVHDFVMLNLLHDTESARHAMLLAVGSLQDALH